MLSLTVPAGDIILRTGRDKSTADKERKMMTAEGHIGRVNRWFAGTQHIDEAEHLGERLALPPFLEPHRAEIEAGLRPLG